MSETSPTEPTSAADETESFADETESSAYEPSPEADVKTSSSAPRASKLPLWITVAALVLAVIATSLAVVGWFFPHKSASSAPTYTDQQVKDAKKTMCETFRVVDHEVVRNSKMKNTDNGGPVGLLAVATAQRVAFYDGGAFLRDQVNQQPAAPADLAKLINGMAQNLQELAIGYYAGVPEFHQDELRQSLDDKIKATIEICKPK